MRGSRAIDRVDALEVIDCRGRPTIRVRIELRNGAFGIATAPSGRSTSHHPRERRDKNDTRYSGDGVKELAERVSGQLTMTLRGKDANGQADIDRELRDFYGADYPLALGTNATCAASMASARAAAMHDGTSLFAHLGGAFARRLPVPMLSVRPAWTSPEVSGFRDIMLVPHGAPTFSEALRYGAETLCSLRAMTSEAARHLQMDRDDAVGIRFDDGEVTCALIVEAITRVGLRPGRDIAIAIDAAAGTFSSDGRYRLDGSDASATELAQHYLSLVTKYPIVTIEDGFAEEGWEDFRAQTASIGGQVQVVGDELYAMEEVRIRRGIEERITNAIVVKMDRAGTLTAAMDAIDISREAGWRHVVSHRSSDSEDTFLADFAVATGCGQIKAGPLTGSESVAKYNRLLEIERELGEFAIFRSPFAPVRGG